MSQKLVKTSEGWKRIPKDSPHPDSPPDREINVCKECSTCKSITFKGIHEFTRKTGWCRRHRKYTDGHLICDHWSQRASELKVRRRIEIDKKLSTVPIRK